MRLYSKLDVKGEADDQHRKHRSSNPADSQIPCWASLTPAPKIRFKAPVGGIADESVLHGIALVLVGTLKRDPMQRYSAIAWCEFLDTSRKSSEPSASPMTRKRAGRQLHAAGERRAITWSRDLNKHHQGACDQLAPVRAAVGDRVLHRSRPSSAQMRVSAALALAIQAGSHFASFQQGMTIVTSIFAAAHQSQSQSH